MINAVSLNLYGRGEGIKVKAKSIVQTVKVEYLCVGTEHPEKFIDELERLCQSFASVQDATNGDGYTFKFSVED